MQDETLDDSGTGSETGGEDSGEVKPEEDKELGKPEEPEKPETPEESDDDAVDVGEENPSEEPGEESGKISDTEKETEETDNTVTTAEGEDAEASGQCGDNLTWTLKEGTLTISGTGEMWDYETVKIGVQHDITVTTSPWVSYARSLSSLVIEEGIASIGEYAFFDCGFSGNLTIPSSVTSIGKWAFSYCGFTGYLKIPDSVSSIGDAAFIGCRDFRGNLTIPSSVTSIGDSVFSNCRGFTGSLIIPDSVTSIGEGAFCDCRGLRGNLTIPDSVTNIGEAAFMRCGFSGSLAIPSNVTSIENNTFEDCSGFSGNLTIPDGVTIIGAGAFYGCSGFGGSLAIPDSVTSIKEHAFYGCRGFDGSLIIPDSVTRIGKEAFYNCSGFTGSLIIPGSVTKIEAGTFYQCSGFRGSLIIPVSVTNIGKSAFSYCSGFTGSLIIPDSVTRIEEEAFDGCSGFSGSLIIPVGMFDIGISAFEGCGFGNLIILDCKWLSISFCAFSGCTGLRRIYVLGRNVNFASKGIFTHCRNCTIYGIPGSSAESYAKENNIPFAPYNPGRPWSADVSLTGYANIYVVDSDLGIPVAGALVNGVVADVDGYAALPVDEGIEETIIDVAADGYISYISCKNLKPNGTYYISLNPTDGKSAIVYAKATLGSTVTNLLADIIYLQHTEKDILGASGKTIMELEVKARGDIQSYTLLQDGAVIASSADGKFSLPLLSENGGNFLTSLKPQKRVEVRASDADGNTTVRLIGIFISPEGAAGDKSGSFSIGSNINMTLPDYIPFLGGGTASYGLENPLPFELTVEQNGHVKIAVNKSSSQSMDAFKEDYDKLSARAQNLSDAAAVFGGTAQPFGAGYFSTKVTVTGYGEGYIDMTKPGNFEIKVGVILTGKGSGNYTQYFMAGFVPVYVSIEAGAQLSGGVNLSARCENSKIQIEGGLGTVSGKIYLTAAAGVGVKKVINVGVAGTGACNYTWKPKDDYTKVWLNAYLELEADCFGWHLNIWKSPEAEYTIYDSKDASSGGGGGGGMGGRALLNSMSAQIYDASSYAVMDRSYLNQETVEQERLFSMEGTDAFVQTSIYPGADPKLVRAGDKFYLFWLQDIPDRSAENRAAVVYASSDDGISFTAPKQLIPESENQTHDNGIDVCVDNGKIYVCWQDAAKTFASGADLNEVAGNQNISYAVVDASTGNVLSHATVTDTAGCYLQPQIYVNNSRMQIAWIRNSLSSEDGLWGTDNQESLQKYDAAAGKIETLSIGNNSEKIISMDGMADSSQAGVAYALDMDGNLQTVSDRVIYFDTRFGSAGSQTRLTEEGMNDNPVAAGGKLYWYADGNISYTTIGSAAVQQIYEEARPDINSNFRVLSEGERTEIIWDAIEYEMEKVALYGISSLGGGQWTSPYEIGQTDSEMTGAISGSLKGGIPYIVYMHAKKQEDGSKRWSLSVEHKKDVTDLSVNYAGYDYEDFKPGTLLPIAVELTNKGNIPVEKVEMRMDGASLGTQGLHLGVGETGSFVLEKYTVPAEINSYAEHTLTVVADGESVTEDNDYQIGIGYTDVRLLCSQRWQDEATWLDLSVLNYSDIASDVTVNIRGDKEDGEILYSEKLGEIAGGKGISMTVSLKPYEDSCCTYFVEAVTGTEDVIEGNNTVFVYTGFGTDIQGGTLLPDSQFYTVSFQSNGGSAVESQQIEEGRSAGEPPIPTKEGSRFVGWYFNGAPYNFLLPITGDITLEAVWEELLVLAAPAANLPSSSEVEIGTKIVLTCAASGVEIYYTLDGTTPSRSSTLYQEPITILEDTTIMAMAVREGYQDSPVAIFSYRVVNLKPSVYIVVFQSNGGTHINSQEVTAGETMPKPADPVREGYRFLGWYLNGELYDFSAPVTGNIRLEAVWEELGTLDMPVSNIASGETVSEGTKIILSTEQMGVKIYYTLNGTTPTAEKGLLYSEPIVITEDTVIIAVAVREGYQDSPAATFSYRVVNPKSGVYIVVFQSNGGTQIDSQEVTAGETVPKPADPVREGYRFISWYLNGELYDFSAPVTGNIRLEAVWEELGTLNMPVSNIASGEAVPEGTEIILSTNQSGVRIYYTLDGMTPTAEKGLLYSEPIAITEDAVIMAVAVREGWKDSPVATFRYTISVRKDDLGDILPEDFPDGGEEAIPAGLWIAGVDEKGYTYTGKAIKPDVRVYDHKIRLRVNKDYSIAYKNNTKANDGSAASSAPSIVVTGKGDYAGKETANFKILAKNIAAKDITAEDITVNYNKKVQRTVPVLLWNGKKLKNRSDYTVEYPDLAGNPDAYKAVGTYTILMRGRGCYEGERKISLVVTQSKLMSRVSVSKITAQPYTGREITVAVLDKAPVVKFGGKLLREGVHYTVSYEDNVEIGTAALVLTGTGQETVEGAFVGKKKVAFKITGGDIKKAAVSGIPRQMVYSGDKISESTPEWGAKPALSVRDRNGVTKTLTEGADYTVEYRKNADSGTAEILFTGINGYTGTLKKTFRIIPYDVQEDKGRQFKAVIEGQPVYAKGGCKPEPIVRFGDVLLEKGRDYILSYKYNSAVNDGKNAGKVPTVVIKGKGNFKGNRLLLYTIAGQDIGNLKAEISDAVYQNKKKAYLSSPKVIDLDGKILKAGTDYEKNYSYSYGGDVTLADGSTRRKGEQIGADDILPVNASVDVVLTGKGNYSGTLTGHYRVTAATISNAKVTVQDQIYSGKEIVLDKSQFTVKVGRDTLRPEDYEILGDSYRNNVKKGRASVTIRGSDSYGGLRTVNFNIKAKRMLWWWK